MSLDHAARGAGADLRRTTMVDTEAGLVALLWAVPRRRRARATISLVTVAVAVLLLAGVIRLIGLAGTHLPAAEGPSPDATSGAGERSSIGCRNAFVTCLSGRTVRFGLEVPVTWTIARGYEHPYSGSPPDPTMAETYRDDGGAGVTVLEHVRAPSHLSSPKTVPGVTTAREFAEWLATRPFLSASALRSTRVDGRDAWEVEVDVRRGAGPGPAGCNRSQACHPITMQSLGWVTGVWDGLHSRYTVFDLPGAGITVVWSWSFDGELDQPEMDRMVAGLRFD